MAAEEKLDEAAKPKAAAKTKSYKCVTKCYWNGTLYNVDDVIVLEESFKDIPEHFEEVK